MAIETKDIIQEGVMDENFNKGTGRIVSIDFRDKNHLMSAKHPATAALPTYKYWTNGKILDQGYTSQCVAYSGEQFLVSGPVTNKFYKTPTELYNECQLVDEWEGENYDGTSVRALFKVLQSKGYIKEYSWAFNINDVVTHLLSKGPVILGTDWYNSMFETDEDGFLPLFASSGLAGGHAYMVKGCNTKKVCPDGSLGAIRIVNSWGTSWGDKGYAWISFRDADRLIQSWGEAATSTELKFKVEAVG